MANYNSKGDAIQYTPTSAVTAGDVIVLGSLVGVATEDIAANALGSLVVEGVFEFPKAVTSADAIAVGAKVYWDDSGEVVTTTAGSLKVAGYTIEAAAASTATILVKLGR